MASKALTCDNLGSLDAGAVRAMVDKALAGVYADLDDRGSDGLPRKVSIELSFKQRDNSEIEVKTQCKTTLPAYTGVGTTCAVKAKDGELTLNFQEHAPSNPHQRTIDEAIDDEERQKRERGE